MCIIASKPKGIDMPSVKTIETMWRNNNDGAGLMYTKRGRVVIEKGFMKLKPLKRRLENLSKEINLKSEAVVMHFRITTHGDTSADNCHPFPITDSIGALRKPRMTTDVGCAHNGIIDIRPRKNISDTMEYIASQLAPLKRAMPKFYKNKDILDMISNAIQSKMVFMNGKGEMVYIGEFIEDDGILYSNSSYEPFYFSYRSSYMYDDYLDGFEDIEEEMITLSWLDDRYCYVLASDGTLADAYDFLIDVEGKLYHLDWHTERVSRADGYVAINHNGVGSPEFDEEYAESFILDNNERYSSYFDDIYEKELTKQSTSLKIKK